MFIDCSKYAGKCACGREHTMETRAAVIEPGCLFEFEKYMAQFGVTGKRCALYGENSYVVFFALFYQLRVTSFYRLFI